MWIYEKIAISSKVNSTNPRLAKLLMTQYGGPDGN